MENQTEENKKPRWKNYFIWIFIAFFICVLSKNEDNTAEFNPNMPVVYNATTLLKNPQIKIIRIALTSSPQTVDISGTGFTNVYAVIPQGENNTSTITAMPNCSLKSFTTSNAVVNTTVSNSSLVSILGTNVIGLTAPTVFTGMYVDLI